MSVWQEKPVFLGKQGENLARTIELDVSEIQKAWPTATFQIVVQPPESAGVYVAATTTSGSKVSWPITLTDTAVAGFGKAELQARQGDVLVKSITVPTEIRPAIEGEPYDYPEGTASWVDKLIDGAETVSEALEDAEQAVEDVNAAVEQAQATVAVLQDKAPAILSTAGPADVATFTDGAAGMPMEVTVTLDPIQAGSGDPAPDNVRAISGHSSVGIMTAGKNLLPGDYYNGDHYTVNGITFTVSDGKIVANGTATATAQYNILSRTANSFILPNGRYRLRGSPAGGGSTTWELGVSVTSAGGGTNTIVRDYRNNGEFDYTQSMGRISTYAIIRSGQTVENFTFEPMLTLVADADEPYEKPACATKTVTFPDPPGTVYGGTLTVKRDGTGKLVVDRETVTLSSTDSWNQISGGRKVFYRQASSVFSRFQAEGNIPVCDMYKGAESVIDNSAAANLDDLCICTRYPTTDRIYIRDNRCETVDDFKASFETINVVLKLATPITYDLTAEQVGQITSVKGVNNVWSAGEVTVTYAADTKAYVDGVAEDVEGIQTTLADYSSVKSKANAALAGGTFTRDSSSGFPWDSGGVLGYNYTCKIPLGGTISGRAVFVSVTAAANNQLSALMNALAPFNKVDATAGYVYLYANTNQYKPTQIKVVVI